VLDIPAKKKVDGGGLFLAGTRARQTLASVRGSQTQTPAPRSANTSLTVVLFLELCQTVRGMAERNFILLRREGKVPAMAGCEKCQRKFFTPAIYSRDAVAAQDYLFSKFDRHDCEEKPRKAHPAW